MVANQRRLQHFCDFARTSVTPGTTCSPHVESLNVQRGEAERILSNEVMKIVINKRPVERRVEANENDRAVGTS